MTKKESFKFFFFKGGVDAHCPNCDRQSTFKGIQEYPVWLGNDAQSLKGFNDFGPIPFDIFMNGIDQVKLVCTRDETHLMQFSFLIQGDTIQKIGQFPSIAEISQPDLRKYRSVLSSEKFKELNRGIGLITHGVGIGAFVYLRRIFEDLIEEAHQKKVTEDDWNEYNYQRSRMEEKIEILKSELPIFLVQNRRLYSILSMGIHELSEKECLEYFPSVKLGVELILDEKLEDKIKQDKIKLANKSISKLYGDIGE